MVVTTPLARDGADAFVELKAYNRISDVLALPNLIEVQLRSFEWFRREGLRELFDEISPIQDFSNKLELRFLDYEFGEPKHSEAECRERDMTYAAPLRVRVQLEIKETGEIKEQVLFMGDFPMMTSNGTFVINGAERVVVSQLVRSPGVYFTREEDTTTGRKLCFAKLIPNRGAWLEFETSNRDVLSVKVDRKRKIPVTVLLRAVGLSSNAEIIEAVRGQQEDADAAAVEQFLRATLDRDPTKSTEEALLEFYRRLRPGEPPTAENARSLLNQLFFNFRRYDLGRVGRYKLNKRLKLSIPQETRTLTRDDLVAIVREMVRINLGNGHADDIDHLGNRRVRAVGELIQNQFRVGLLRMERVIRERMTITDADQATPSALVNIRPVVAAIKEFFGGSQLSQFMDQTNPLAELTHKRRLSALGPGGLSRDRAGFEVRDVHYSHYGRICPIETPEGPNIGLIGSLATFGRINDYGFIETPYRKVVSEVDPRAEEDVSLLVGRTLREAVIDDQGRTIAEPGTRIDATLARRLVSASRRPIRIRPFVTDEVQYLTADDEDNYLIAQANSPLNEQNEFIEPRVEARHGERFLTARPEQVQLMDVSPKQIVSVAASLIPFLEHDDANRALMGSNMQRQAVPLVAPEAPLVGTGMEGQVARDSGQVTLADVDGVVLSCTSDRIIIRDDAGYEHIYPLMKFIRSNQATCINQRPIVFPGDRVRAGQPIADSSSTERGELALGQNVLCAFMSWDGSNFEDAIILSEGVVREDKFTSIHIEKHEVEARDTKLGPEEITRDIPNVGEESLRDLDEDGIIRIGAEVGPGDILVGKITPKGETELSAEEKLLRAIFGEKASDVRDTSLRVPPGVQGTVVEVRVFNRHGVEKDERALAIEREEIERLAKDRDDEQAILDRNVYGRLAEMLENKIAVSGPKGFKKDSRITRSILEEYPRAQWWQFALANEKAMAEIEALRAQYDESKRRLEQRFLDKVEKLQRGDELPPGVMKMVKVFVAVKRKIQPGDKMAGRHGNKGVVSKIVPVEDMPFLADGTPVDIVLNPLGVPSRMNVGQILETHLGWVAANGWYDDGSEAYKHAQQNGGRVYVATPVFDGATVEDVDEALCRWAEEHGEKRGIHLDVDPKARPGMRCSGKVTLYNGRTGEPFEEKVTVGYMYILKLLHLVDDKIHARSTGPYSLVTQQPLGGKAQFGGQRFGEMEVWALEAYGSAYTLQEMLTIKSDDTVGRVKAYEAIVKGENIPEPSVPESFQVLLREMKALALDVEPLSEEGDGLEMQEEEDDLLRAAEELGIDLSGTRARDDEAADEAEEQIELEGEGGQTGDEEPVEQDAQFVEGES
ncbi:MAG: DNA-directed RNA polymerase subunit beta [Chloroflexi bacterium]|nr:DNA-directed RNA polymerase subunit beta [Chloroflexota bacterium]